MQAKIRKQILQLQFAQARATNNLLFNLLEYQIRELSKLLKGDL